MNTKQSFQEKVSKAIFGSKALEIGGPSKITFNDLIPVYDMIESLDITVYAKETMWNQASDTILLPNSKEARFFVAEGTELQGVEDESYETILASHCLEHVSNPIKALFTWKRAIKKGGYMVVILPWKQSTFDHNRPITPIETLIKKYEDNVGEDDLSMLDEVLSLHDLFLDPPAGNLEQFKARCLKNYENRGIHCHVFDFSLIRKVAEYVGLEWCGYSLIKPNNEYVLLRKPLE
jgi:SAM-dependent methyltransferase